MPIGGPDRYFLSNFDTQVLLAWIREIRDEITALNPPSSVLDGQMATIVLNNKLRSFGYYALFKHEQQIQDQKIKNQHEDTREISKQYAIISKEEIEKDTITYQGQQVSRALAENAQIYNELKIANNLTPKDEELLKTNNQYQFDRTDQVPFISTLTPVTGSVIDPTTNTVIASGTGEEILLDNNLQINESYNEIKEFTVKTGYKKKGQQLDKIFKSWVSYSTNGTPIPNDNNSFTPKSPYSSKVEQIIKNIEADKHTEIFSGSFKFFIEKLHGRNSKAPYKKNKIKSTKVKNLNSIPEELSNRMVFAAYIDNFYDDYSVSWNEYNFLGRGEGVPVYKSTKRSLTLVFDIISDHSAEYMLALERLQNQTATKENGLSEDILNKILNTTTDWGDGYQGGVVTHTADGNRISSHIPGLISDTPEGLWTKLTFLAQCVYPFYRPDGKMKEQPFVRIRIADFYDVVGTIESISVELNETDGVQMDLNPSSLGNIPLFAKVNMKLTIYHDYEPSSTFYGFYHRKEFDKGTIDKVTGKGLTTTQPTKNSPSQFIPTDIKDSLLEMPAGFESYFKGLNEDLKNFKKNFSSLKNSGLKLKDALFKEKFKESIESYNKITVTARQIQALRGESATQSEVAGTATKNQRKGLFSKEGVGNFKTTVNDLQDNFTTLYGNAQAIIAKTGERIRKTNETLNRFGINLKQNDDIQELLTKADQLKPNKFIPKTLGDIIDKMRKK